jgi:hypothetical protein
MGNEGQGGLELGPTQSLLGYVWATNSTYMRCSRGWEHGCWLWQVSPSLSLFSVRIMNQRGEMTQALYAHMNNKNKKKKNNEPEDLSENYNCHDFLSCCGNFEILGNLAFRPYLFFFFFSFFFYY